MVITVCQSVRGMSYNILVACSTTLLKHLYGVGLLFGIIKQRIRKQE